MSILQKLLDQVNSIIQECMKSCCSYYDLNDKELTLDVIKYIDRQLTYNFRMGLLLKGIIKHPKDFELCVDIFDEEADKFTVGIQYKGSWVQDIDDLGMIILNEYIGKDIKESINMING